VITQYTDIINNNRSFQIELFAATVFDILEISSVIDNRIHTTEISIWQYTITVTFVTTDSDTILR